MGLFGLKQPAAISILGSTGSIGVSTLDVIRRHPDRYKVVGLTASRQVDVMFAQCLEFAPSMVAMAEESAARALREKLAVAGLEITVVSGDRGLCDVAADLSTDTDGSAYAQYKVMAAIVGGAGLKPTLAAAAVGKQILLANKEAIVMAGDLFLQTCKVSGAQVLPIDSEHNAIFQCLPSQAALRTATADELSEHFGIAKIILTASGGPFRSFTLEQMHEVTPDQACAHPKWQMGRKISVDSATMMNKGLELIEAHHLFNVPAQNLEVLFHPQSVIHSMVTYTDGSVLAQLGNPDMRTPIAHALAYPARIASGVAPLDLVAISKLEFEAPDPKRFPCLGLATRALSRGGNSPCVLNAANEVSVTAFLQGEIRFTDIARINEAVLSDLESEELVLDLKAVFAIDSEARAKASEYIGRLGH